MKRILEFLLYTLLLSGGISAAYLLGRAEGYRDCWEREVKPRFQCLKQCRFEGQSE